MRRSARGGLERGPCWTSLLVVSRAVGDPAFVTLLPAPRVAFGVAKLAAGLVRDAQGALALGVRAFGVVVLGPRLPGLLPLLLLVLLLPLLEVGAGRALVEQRQPGVRLAALRAGAVGQLRLDRLLAAGVGHADVRDPARLP